MCAGPAEACCLLRLIIEEPKVLDDFLWNPRAARPRGTLLGNIFILPVLNVPAA
jgi:hypothetical protein